MDLYERFREFYFTDQPRGYQKLLRAGLIPFVPVYAAARRLHQTYRRYRSVRLDVPVVSVGNISLGGTGKTAFCLEVLDSLIRAGKEPGLLKRGEGEEDGIPSRDLPVHDLARRYGDEVALYRNRYSELPVGVGSDRVKWGRRLIEETNVDVLLLDDGFQYRRIERDLDVVLLTPSDGVNNWQLPAGPLREPIGALNRADSVSLKGVTSWEEVREDWTDLVDDRKLRRLTHRYDFDGIYSGGENVTERFQRDGGVLVSTLARPDELESFLETNGIVVHEHYARPDHAELSHEDFRREINEGRLMMTEKEAVKFPNSVRDRVGVIRSQLSVEPRDRFEEDLSSLNTGNGQP